MSKLRPEDVHSALSGDYSAMWDISTKAVGLMASSALAIPEMFGEWTNRAKSTALHDHVVANAKMVLPDLGWTHFVSRNVDLFRKGLLILRFKKSNAQGMPVNVSTSHNDILCNDGDPQLLFDFAVRPTFLTVAHRVTPEFFNIISMNVLCMAGDKSVSWSLPIPKSGTLVNPAIQKHIDEIVPGKSSEEILATKVIPKESTRKNRKQA